jgi:bifunctional DNA-binding transcriptional regulator/antitoxin component of YhaV-PrlF toxin-antitoxin module
MAHKSGSACKKDFHSLESLTILNCYAVSPGLLQIAAILVNNAKLHYNNRRGNQMAIVSTTSRGQVTLRKEIFQHVGIRPGEKLEIELLPGGEFRGRAVQKRRSIGDLAGFLKGKTNGARLTIEEMDEAIGEAVVEEFLRGVQR